MMINKLLPLLLLTALQIGSLHAADPLRVFIRSGPKTHGPGAHDHPAFLKDWTKLLNERGAKATGGDTFPTREQFAAMDVLILHAEEAGNIEGADRKNLEAFLKRGGGVVAIHAGTVSRDPDWYKTVLGGSWNFDHTQWCEGHMSLYFTDRENPITRGASNFDLDDEIYYDMDILPDVKILAAAYTPKPKNGADSGRGKPVNVYDIQPQIWTYETGNRRAFACIPGHMYENFAHTSLQTIILRGIAWAGKMKDSDALSDQSDLPSALRYPVGGPTRPELAADKIELHPEFDISLVAAEPLINKVMNLDWDEKGRLWVVETPEYPNGLRKANTDVWKDSGSVEPGDYQREPQDRISILHDSDGDGVMDKKHVFADKLELATSFVFYKNGVIVSAAPNIWYLEDSDGDSVADKRTKLYTGLGNRDTHAVMNNLRWGLDGWIYATHGYSAGKVKSQGAPERPEVGIGSGVVRFKPDGTEIEMYTSRGGNTWGLCMTSDGQCFWTQPTSGTLFFHTVLPEHVLARGKIAGTSSWRGMIERQKVFPMMDWKQLAYVQIDHVGSYTAAAGCAVYEGGAWPEKWNYSYFTGEPTVNIVSQYFVKPDGVTYTTSKETGREETEFIRSSDLWFRPIETRIGPDGALYVVDFYNQAVIHNDTRGPLHGPANAAVRPDRDHHFGRIWKINHKKAKQITVPVIDKSKMSDLTAALKSPNGHTRMTAMRLIREAGKSTKDFPNNGSAALAAFEAFDGASTPAQRAGLIAQFAEATDPWTKSALVAAASGHPVEMIIAAFSSPKASQVSELVSNLLPAAVKTDPSNVAGRLIVAAAAAPNTADSLKAVILDAVTNNNDAKPGLTPTLSAALAKLLANPATASKTLPIISRWDTKGTMAAVMEREVASLSAELKKASAPVGTRIGAARALIAIGSDPAISDAIAILASTDQQPIELQRAILSVLGETGHAERLTTIFPKLTPALQSPAFDEIVKRPAAALALLEMVDQGTLSATVIAPGNIARLRNHPNRAVSKRASALLDKLMPGAKAKAETIARLLPEVVKPGNVANGRVMFTAACAICHKYDDLGKSDVGPSLTGMGAHGAAELLVHLVDPNREVDPTFWQWNITTKKGEALAGIIISENSASVTLRNQAGDVEIQKDDIASRDNTRRSLMPEGLDALGPEVIRDILAFMTAGEERFRVLDLRDAYTADARRGLFADEKRTADSVFPRKHGNITAAGIPFFLMDPKKSANGKSLVVLKGGGKNHIASTHPQKVEIETHVDATRLYLVSGIAGWGFPATKEKIPAMKVTVTHADGGLEVHELRNGVAFADYNRRILVPGSKILPKVVQSGQVRLITLDVKKPGPVTKITLESYNNRLSPVVVAITADLSDKPAPKISVAVPGPKASVKAGGGEPAKSIAATGQKFAEPKKTGTLRVLIVGAGSSHHFPRDFVGTDRETLGKIPNSDVIGTMNLAEALVAMPLADVLVFSGNHDQFGTKEFQKALHDFANAGKGIVLIHAATWSHPWPGYNKRFVDGETRGHGYGEVGAKAIAADHPIIKGVPETFTITDESYHFKFFEDSDAQVLIENDPDNKTKVTHPSLWIVKDPKTRIVCYTHGHAVEAHAHPAYQKILTNAVKWVAAKN